MSNLYVKMITVLCVIAVISGSGLSYVDSKSRPIINKNKEEATKKAVLEVLPKAKSFEKLEKDGMTIYLGKDDQGSDAGVAFIAIGNGWGSVLTLMVGADLDEKELLGMKVLDQRETPGLGDPITKPAFQNQFKGLSFEKPLDYVKNRDPDDSENNKIRALTGATITSRSVINIINLHLEKVIKILDSESSSRDGKQ